ncbi:discoidin domain-containing protein [Duganella guangzhouensis]|nr:discoidin domain-containing protein [Duganella guangzhouensis]
MFRIASIVIAMFVFSVSALVHAADIQDLAGQWRFALDRSDEGIQQAWYGRDLGDKISLPGILQAQGYGDDISVNTPWVLSLYDKNWAQRADYQAYTQDGNVKVPFLSQPAKHYLGAAWYQRQIEVPSSWRGKRVVLFMERPHWGSTLWVDGKKVGSNLSLVAEHEYDLGQLAPGKHRISVRVDNRMLMPYRPDAHSVSDSLGMSWNGIVGKIELRATSPVWLDDVQLFPNYADKSVLVKVGIGNISGRAGQGTLTANGKPYPVRWDAQRGTAEITVQYPKTVKEWNEFTPALQRLSLQLAGRDAKDARNVSFGFARISAKGREFLLNGRSIYLRGTHHGGDFPLTGYPPTDVAYWRKIFQINKDWGINHIRFHSFCPPEAAFQAADELGIYLQPEPGMWNDVSPGTEMEKMLYEETDRIIKAYGNHPSFVLLSPSNEPKGRWKEAFDKWIAHYRQVDPRRLYSNGTGHTEREVPDLATGTDYLVMQRIGAKPLRGARGWFGRDYGESLNGINVPVLSHETGQWVAYPDFDVIRKFTGYLRPGNYEIFRDSLAKHGMADRNKDFAWASGKFQLENYKEEIEANLRTPGMMGFQLLDLHDYLGQGTALVGLLDTFWEEKGYVTAAEFRRFNGETVPLARLTQRTYTADETLSAEVEIAHFGALPLVDAQPYWKLLDAAGHVAASGNWPRKTINIGKNIPLGKIALPLTTLPAPQAYRLVVGLEGTRVENDWRIWVYPAKPAAQQASDVLVTRNWEEAAAGLQAGGKVLYLPSPQDLDWSSPPLDTVPVFWNRLMSPAWGRMLGVWVDQHHPALAQFPTDGYNGWQWNELLKNTRAINLDRLPAGLQPIVQPVDDWNRNYKLGLLFEAKVGNGKLMVASVDLVSDLSKRVVARQLRLSVLNYMASPAFDPRTAIDAATLSSGILFDTQVMKKLATKAEGGKDAAAAIDGDPNTYWSGDNQRQQPLTLSFPQPVSFTGLVLMPRQNHRDHEGDIREYLLQVSDDGSNWRDVKRGTLVSTYAEQTVDLGQSVSARYLRLVPLSGFGADQIAALAELALIYSGPKLQPNAGAITYKQQKSASPDVDENLPVDGGKKLH